jgi:poly(3-hydroxybutyrate) depolymerase
MRHHAPMPRTLLAIWTLLLLTGPATDATAELIEKTGRFGGLQVTYKVLLPPGYDPARTYPAVLVFTGGPQQLRGAENTIRTDWQEEAEKRGYIVVSPGAPEGRLFFQEGDRIFPEFLDTIIRDYRIRGGRLHVAGHSNGGLSAYHVAAKHPSYFLTVTGYPGLLDGQSDPARIQALEPMCLFMHVGDQDTGWLNAMQRQADSLRQQGYRIRYTVERNQVHRLRAAEIDLPARLFDQIESCR